MLQQAQRNSMLSIFGFQKEAIDAVAKELFEKRVDRTLLCLATGGGKTISACAFIRDKAIPQFNRCRVLYIVNREEIFRQTCNTISSVLPGISVTPWSASKKDASGNIVVAMIASTKKLEGEFDVVIVDEAHHLGVASDDQDPYHSLYTKLLNRLRWKKLLGLTATPVRLDRRPLGFDSIAYQRSFLDLVKIGRLSAPIYVSVRTKLKFDLKTSNGEFTDSSLKTLNQEERNKKIVEHWIANKHLYGKTLLFAINVEQAHTLSRMLNEVSPGSARAIDGSMKDKERRENLSWFSDGNFDTNKILVNCQVFVEGVDEPSIRTVLNTRPTMSKTLWLQMVGRGARILKAKVEIPRDSIKGISEIGNDGVLQIDTDTERFNCEVIEETQTHFIVNKHICNTFYIVSILDDISKYPFLLQEWELETREPTSAEVAAAETKKIIEQKYAALEEIEEQTGTDLDIESTVLDVKAVLVYSTEHEQQGIPMDSDKLMCLYRLKEYTRQCFNEGSFDFDRFKDAYPVCVPNSELPLRTFEGIKWAYYNQYVKGANKTRNIKTGLDLDTWKMYEIDDLIENGSERALEDIKVQEQKNANFNKLVSTSWPEIRKKIVTTAFDIASEEGGKKAWILKSVLPLLRGTETRPEAWNRAIILAVNQGAVSTGRDLGFLKVVSSLLTKAAQRVFNDPAITCRIRSS